MEINKDKKLGLVLEGGGARGAYQAGALKALFEAGYKFDAVVGTSVGALNGVMVAQNRLKESYKIWDDIDFATVLNIKNEYGENVATKNIDGDTIKYFVSFFKNAIAQKGIDTSKIQALIAENIDEDILRNSGIDFGIMTFSLTEKKPVPIFVDEMPYGSVAKYVMASATFPGFKRTTVDNQDFIDGGVYDNMPVNMLIERGYKDIVAIETKSYIPKRKPKDKNVQILYIRPSIKPGRVMDFTPKSTEQAVLIGYFDTQRILKGLVGKTYYLDVSEKTPFGYGLCDFDERVYEKIAQIIQVSYLNQNVLSGILCKEFKFKEKNIADTFICVLEKVATLAKIQKLKVYKFDEFVKLVANSCDNISATARKTIEREISIVKLIGENI